jgi:hypothetical protein
MNTPITVTIKVTEEEAKIIMSGLDLTVKQGGINVASQVMPVAVKVSDAFKATEPVTNPQPEPATNPQ